MPFSRAIAGGEPLAMPERLYIITDFRPVPGYGQAAVQPQGCTPAAYRRRRPTETPLYRTVQNHLETFLALCRDDWEEERVSPHAEHELRRYLECGILAFGFARARCGECGHDFLVAFIHRFGSSLNLHTHFHVCAIDGVFEPDPDHGIRFIAMDELDTDDAAAVQGRVRRRILRAFVRRGLLDKDDRKEREQWNHGGGFSLDATVRIADDDRRGLERLLRYCARPPFAGERIEELDRHRLIYHLLKPGPDGRAGSEQISVPGAVQPCSRQGVRQAAKVHWTFGPDSPTTAPTPASLLRRAGLQRSPACCRHRPGARGGSRATHASANL